MVGVYRLTMKRGSDNFRESAVLDIVHWLKTYKCQTIIFEPKWNKEYYEDIKVEKQIQKFKEESDLIIANRITEDLSDVLEKTYTRDIIQ
ncbi:UDP binding domain-containing protein [Sellimonas intestinalis]|uniref:UDP binding domain-containing protein n=1 Tax=Sellimonas intestinalis TaxID=1653434 RepID=UPI0039A0CEFE